MPLDKNASTPAGPSRSGKQIIPASRRRNVRRSSDDVAGSSTPLVGENAQVPVTKEKAVVPSHTPGPTKRKKQAKKASAIVHTAVASDLRVSQTMQAAPVKKTKKKKAAAAVASSSKGSSSATLLRRKKKVPKSDEPSMPSGHNLRQGSSLSEPKPSNKVSGKQVITPSTVRRLSKVTGSVPSESRKEATDRVPNPREKQNAVRSSSSNMSLEALKTQRIQADANGPTLQQRLSGRSSLPLSEIERNAPTAQARLHGRPVGAEVNRNLSANHRSTDMSKGGVANTPVPAKQEQVTVKEEGEIADSQEYACEQCEKKFDRKSCLSNHMKVHQSSAEKTSARKKAPKRRKESTPTKSVSAKRKMGEPSKPVETVGPSEIAPAYISSVSLFDFVKGAPVPILEPDASDAQNENASAGPLTTTAEEQPAVEHPPSFAFPAMPAPVDSEIAGDEDLKMGDDEKTPPLDDDLAYLIDPDL